jgi:uncharacterized membrane protein YfcA
MLASVLQAWLKFQPAKLHGIRRKDHDILLLYLATGAVTGAFAGLLCLGIGIGGGIVIVPLLTFVFTAQEMPAAYIFHLALGTSWPVF